MLKTTIEKITPHVALNYLARNVDHNRKLKPSVVKTLIGILQRGEWLLTHQGIAFDREGNLIDGQHRLQAIADSGITATMTVTRNVAPEAFKVIDDVTPRTVADHLRLDPRIVVPINFLIRFYVGETKPQTAKQAEQFLPALLPPLTKLIAYCGMSRRGYSSAPFRAAAVVTMLLHPEEEQDVLQFYKDMIEMNIDKLPPVGGAMIRKFTDGTIQTSRREEAFLYAMAMFDPYKRNNHLLRIGYNMQREIRQAVRRVIARELKEKGYAVPPWRELKEAKHEAAKKGIRSVPRHAKQEEGQEAA